MSKPKVIVILGQTSTGKSDLAISISKALAVNGVQSEVISADSRQVYKGLDLGTGKITKKEMQGIPHHLLDVANPKNKFTVVLYQEKAIYAMADIVKKGKVPIICGGTGFYIDAVVNGIIFPEVEPNQKLRKQLYSKSAIALFEYLKKLDKNRAKDIKNKNEQNNKVRLIRAIEIAKALGKVPPLRQDLNGKYNFIKIGLHLPAEILKERIKIRLEKRIKMGMIKEVKNLHKNGLSWKRMEELGLEYRYVALYLQKKITLGHSHKGEAKQEMLEKLNSEIYKYAKRQMTWFKRDKEIKWFTPNEIEGFEANTKNLLNKVTNKILSK